jgi:pimeloyl-ACP methyl ester carboxylesterase
MSEPRTQTLNVPGARLAYDIRDAEGDSRAPVLLMIGHPMDATGFTALAGHFRDRTVVTYDPRGAGRSEPADRTQVRTPELHADDLHRLISALNAGPVDIFASSGGAINALELVARHPEQVHTLIAHEPPSAPVLPDHEQAQAAIKDIRKTYEREGSGPAMAKFIVLTSLKGPIPADFAQQSPNPADFGLPTEDDGSRDDPLLGASFVPITHYAPDFNALQAAPTRIVIAAGVESEGTLAQRAALAIAERLHQEAVIFPSHHGGFLGGEFGYRGDPDAFAVTLRRVLDEEGVRGTSQDLLRAA